MELLTEECDKNWVKLAENEKFEEHMTTGTNSQHWPSQVSVLT